MKSIKRAGIFIVLLAMISGFAACGGPSSGKGTDGKIPVAVTILPEKTFVEAVCGELAEVIVMVPPGYSPEHYEPAPQDMAKFSESEIYFAIGMPVEENSVFGTLPDSTALVRLDEACRESYDDLMIGGERDPHIWLSPKRAVAMIRTIAGEMSGLDKKNASVYEANAEEYISQIEDADAEIKDMLINLEQRGFIVFHPAFGYFAEEYGLQMYALEEHGKEATAATLMDMADFAMERGIKTVFYQAEIDSSQAGAFAEEIGGSTIMLDPLSADYINNLKVMARAIAEGA